MRIPIIVFLLLLTPTASASMPPTIINYLGTIDHQSSLAFSLTSLPFNETESSVAGSYFFASHNQEISLDGNATDGKITLKATHFPEIDAGTYSLSPTENGLKGTWLSPDKKQHGEMTLTAIAETFYETTNDQNYVATGFLFFEPDSPFHKALNTHLRRAAEQFQKHQINIFDAEQKVSTPSEMQSWQATYTPSLLYADSTLVSIRYEDRTYIGSTHDNFDFFIENYAWQNHHLIAAPTILLNTEAARKKLTRLCIEEFKKQHAPWAENFHFKNVLSPSVNFTSQGIVVTCAPYAVGPFGAGAYTILIPFEKIEDIIPPSSPLMRFIKPPQ